MTSDEFLAITEPMTTLEVTWGKDEEPRWRKMQSGRLRAYLAEWRTSYSHIHGGSVHLRWTVMRDGSSDTIVEAETVEALTALVQKLAGDGDLIAGTEAVIR